LCAHFIEGGSIAVVGVVNVGAKGRGWVEGAEQADFEQIWEIISFAKETRKNEGSTQWQDGYPNEETIQNDIQKGYGFVFEEDFSSRYEQVLEKIHLYEGVIIRSRIPLDAHFLEKAKNLKFIARVGAGMENIDTAKAQELGIKLINSPEGNKDAVAEHVIGTLLVLMNRLFISSNEVKKGIWVREENRGEEKSEITS